MLKRHSLLSNVFRGAVVAALGMSTAFAQNYPSKPIRMVIPGAGSNLDMVGRLIGQAATKTLGQPIVIDNRPAGVISGQVVLQSAPDGYTLLYTSSSFWLDQFLQSSTPPYDPIRDFQPVTQTTLSPAVLVVHPALPVNSVKELIAMAKSRPGELNYATASTGSVTHLTGELFQSMGGFKLVRIPYKSGAQAVADVVSGRVQMMFAVTGTVMPQVRAGKLKALAVTSAQRTELAPGVPSLAESGLPGYRVESVAGIFVPEKTPRAVVNRLNQEIVRALATAEVKDKLLASGVEPIGSSPEQLETAVKTEIATMGKLIKDLGIRQE